mmetsp:Transcript_15428/g.52015  ORF Transcript_15428/g.52015 Transcript_15428/m.52015 type:complete len:151 (+) Transcript_15428:649-1101(+)
MMRRVEVGDAAAMCALGLAHLKGEDGLRPDAGRAIALFRKAAAKGHVQGHELTALCYQQGLGVSKNAAHAKRSLERAAAMGSEHASYGLMLHDPVSASAHDDAMKQRHLRSLKPGQRAPTTAETDHDVIEKRAMELYFASEAAKQAAKRR